MIDVTVSSFRERGWYYVQALTVPDEIMVDSHKCKTFAHMAKAKVEMRTNAKLGLYEKKAIQIRKALEESDESYEL